MYLVKKRSAMGAFYARTRQKEQGHAPVRRVRGQQTEHPKLARLLDAAKRIFAQNGFKAARLKTSPPAASTPEALSTPTSKAGDIFFALFSGSGRINPFTIRTPPLQSGR
jgi:hypothetical protein